MTESPRQPDHPSIPEENTVYPTRDVRPDAPTTDDTAVLADRPDTTQLPQERGTDTLALAAAVVFCLIALVGLVGTSLPGWVFGGGLIAVLLVLAGVALLVSELRKRR